MFLYGWDGPNKQDALFFFFNLKTNQIFFFHFKISGIQLGMILISWEERRNHLFRNLNTVARGAEKKKQVEAGCSIHCQCQQEVVTLDLPAKPKTPCQGLSLHNSGRRIHSRADHYSKPTCRLERTNSKQKWSTAYIQMETSSVSSLDTNALLQGT